MQLVAKQFIGASELLEDSFKLASKILAGGFKPTFIVGIWRGGAPIILRFALLLTRP